MTTKEWYYARKQAGLCLDCPAAVSGRVRCAPCSVRHKASGATRVGSGLCFDCAAPVVPGAWHCELCAKGRREKKRARTAARKIESRCTECSTGRCEGAATRCPHCIKARADSYQRRKQIIKPEAVAERRLVSGVSILGGMCPKFIDPARRGAPDRMVMLPGRPVYFVEMKRARFGRVKPWQTRYHEDLRALGHPVWVLWSEPDVDKFLAEIST